MKLSRLAPLLLALCPMLACTQKMKALDNQSGQALKPKVSMTSSFKSLAELPRCDAGSEQMSAYISDRDFFVKCRSFFWRDVKPGDTSGKYMARDSIRYNEWIDRNTRLRWSLHKPAEVAKALVKPGVCSRGWKLPTAEELVQASSNGLFEGLKAHGGLAFDKAWTASLDAIVGVSKGPLASLLPQTDQEPAALTACVYCVASVN